ncbi:MAG: flagellar biosynthesis protein FlhF [Lachnospiraceae bacterium]|nr:flagellar biosynthesis protein FlhF [Lachnospiraceae bacterium]
MIIKKFQGKTEEEAVSAAKKELGNGVVIMNVRNARKKGFLSIFKKSLVEVTVALEEEQEKPVLRPRPITPRPVQKPVYNPNIIPEPENPPEKTETVKPASVPKPGKDSLLEEKLDNLQSFIEKQLSREEAKGTPEEEKSPVLELIYRTLVDNEITEEYAKEIIDEVGKVSDDSSSIDFILANVYQKMILQFGQPKTIIPATEGVKIIFFIGPTGVGKTTTIAKIASILTVNDKKKIALVTSDTYRVGAAEQLRTYAGILQVPFQVVYTAEEMESAIRDFKKYDYILVDTAGHSHHNEELKKSVSQFISCVEEDMEKDIYLVLSATTKYRDLKNITDAYGEFTDYKLIFTKLDETLSYGNLFNIRKHTGADMSYVTVGQNVPDDIEPFSPQTTVKQLLGGR